MRINSIVLMIAILGFSVYAYDMDPEDNSTVHQHLTNESKLILELITPEMENHLTSRVASDTIDGNYDPEIGDDTITGSAEDDRGPESAPFLWHFWNPDDPNTPSMTGNDDYNDGLLGYDSSYRRALNFWRMKVIPLYLKGEIDESYYYLGRVAHLLEDASQPSHMHNDPHLGHRQIGPLGFCITPDNPDCDDSFLEAYTGKNFTLLQNTYYFSGENFANHQYNYERLPGVESFDWTQVQPTRAPDKQHVGLFRLFWYTAQKTQYYASDSEDVNDQYIDLSGNSHTFSPSLWIGDNVSIVSDKSDFFGEDYNWSQTSSMSANLF